MTESGHQPGDEAVSLRQRMRSRKVVQWAVGYLAAAWLALQVVDVLGEQWGWSAVVGRTITLALAVGLLVVLTLAWYHGEQDRQRVSGPEIAILSLLFVIGAYLVMTVPARPSTDALESSANTTSPGVLVDVAWDAVDDRPGIAALPFEDLNASEETRPFVEGLHADILSRLWLVDSLRVISKGSVEQYRGVAGRTREIGRELQVGTLLRGWVQRTSERVLVRVELTSTLDDSQLWSHAYDTTLTASNIFAVQALLAEEIVEKLGVRVTAAERGRLSGGGTESLRALDLFDEARALLERNIDPVENERATRLVQEAIRLDPTFVGARAELANLFAFRPQAGLPLHWADSAAVLARELIEVAPQSAEAWASLGNAHSVRGRLMEARTAFFRALELAPGHSDATYNMATTYHRKDESLLWVVRSIRLDPKNAFRYAAAGFLNHGLGRWDEADVWFRRALELDRQSRYARLSLTVLEIHTDRLAEARERAHRWLAEALTDPLALYAAFYTDLMAGDPEALEHGDRMMVSPRDATPAHAGTLFAAELIRRGQTDRASDLLRDAEQFYSVESEEASWDWELGRIRALQGRREEALAALNRALDRGHVDVSVSNPRREWVPALESLWDDPAFQELLLRVGEQQRVQRARVEAVAESLRPPGSSMAADPGGGGS